MLNINDYKNRNKIRNWDRLMDELKEGYRFLENGQKAIQFFYEGVEKPIEFKNPSADVYLTREEAEEYRGTTIMKQLIAATEGPRDKLGAAISIMNLLGVVILIIIAISMFMG